MEKSVKELAALIGGTLYGKGDVLIHDVRSAEKAGPEDITFAAGIYAEHIEEMQAGAIVVEALPEHYTKNLIVVDNARAAFSKLINLYHPQPVIHPGIHPTAVVSKKAVLGKDVAVMAYAVIEDDAVIGDGTVIYPYVYVGHNVRMGKQCELYPGAVVHENCVLGDRVVLRAHAVIGGQGFGFANDEKGHHTHIQQLGNVILKDDVEVGAGSAIDNGAMDATVVGRGTKIDNLVHLGHNVEVGEDCFLIAQTGVAGSTKIGNQCILAGQTGVTGHITITDHVVLGGKTGVIGNIDKPGVYVGYPARPRGEWGRVEVLLGKLPELLKKVRRLEKALAEKK